MRVIAVTNQKGGVGKSTSTINIGFFLSSLGKKTLIVDLDPQGNTTTGLGISKDKVNSSIYDVLLSPEDVNQAILGLPIKNLDLIPAKPNLVGAEIELLQTETKQKSLLMSFTNLEQEYDYILIDCPPALGLLTINALSASSDVLIPVQAEFFALEGMIQLLSSIHQVKQLFNPKLNLLGVFMTMAQQRTSLSSLVYQELKDNFHNKLFKTTIPRNIRLAEAPSHGLPIYMYDKFSKGSKAYKKLTKEILSRVK